MIDTPDSSLDSYRARLSQALGTAQYGQDPDNQGAGPDVDAPPAQATDSPTIDGRDSSGQGPQIDAPPPAQAQGSDTDPNDAPPSIASPAPASSGPQGAPLQPTRGGGGGSIDGADTPTLDSVMPNPLQQAPTAPTAQSAPTAGRARTARTAPTAPTAATAPTVDGAPTAPQADQAPTAATASQAAGADPNDPANTGPPGFKPKYNAQALNDATTHGAIFGAMDKKSQTQYMDWWEKEHGDIDAKYAKLKDELGKRPDPQRDPTQREKFQTLLDFGMSLMKNSGRGRDPVRATGEALTEAEGNQQARQAGQTSTYDAKVAQIESQRQASQKELGNYGQAVREDAIITDARTRTHLADTREQIAIANAQKPPKQLPVRSAERSYDKNGNMVVRDDEPSSPTFGKWLPATGADGKPIGPQEMTGARGGSYVRGGGSSVPHTQIDSSTGTVTLYNPATRQYEPAINTATGQPIKAVDKKKTGDPSADYQRQYLGVMRSSGGDTDLAKASAQDFVEQAYGANAMANQRAGRAPTTSSGAPPASMLKEGKAQKFGNGQTWTLKNGVPTQVH